MGTSEIMQLVILFILLILSAFFSSAETSLTCVNKVKMKTLADEGNKAAARVLAILDSPGKMLSTILIGNNLVNISTTSLATTLTIRLFGSVFVGVVTGILTILILLFGEIVPKSAASMNAEKMALAYSPVIKTLMTVLTPVIYIVDKLSGLLFKLFHIDAEGAYNPMTESELKTYVEVSHEDGAIEPEEREMILNVFDLGDSLAKDIMIPRIEMTMVEVNASYTKLQNLFKNTLYSRIPVYEEDKDHIIGSVNLKDFFLVTKKADFHIRSIMRECYYTYETKKTDDLLVEMREKAINLAVVLDEYGSAAGMITLEDLLEEIVGDIRDEYDEEENELIIKIDEYHYDIAGSVKLDDINDALSTSYDSEDYDSIGGIMIEQLDRLPRKGEIVTLADGTTLTASSISTTRVLRVALALPVTKDDGESAATLEESGEPGGKNA